MRDAEQDFAAREDALRAQFDAEKATALKDAQEEMDDLLEVLGLEERQKDFLFRELIETYGEDLDVLEEKLDGLTCADDDEASKP